MIISRLVLDRIRAPIATVGIFGEFGLFACFAMIAGCTLEEFAPGQADAKPPGAIVIPRLYLRDDAEFALAWECSWRTRECDRTGVAGLTWRFASMRRLSPSLPIVSVVGLAIGLSAGVPGSCFGFHWTHGTAVVTTYPVVPVAPVAMAAPVSYVSTPMMVPAATPVSVTAPGYVAPMMASPVAAMPMQYSVAAYPYAASAGVAPAYYPAAPAYYAGASPFLPATPSTPQTAGLPVAPFSFLSNFNPDAPLMPALAGYDAAMPQARGGRILQGLRNALVGNKGMLFGSLLQLAVNLFGQEFGFSPGAQDASILSGLVNRVLCEVLGTGSSNANSNPNPTPNPAGGGGQAAATEGAQTLVITITLPAGSRIHVQQGGQPSGTQSWQPVGQATGTSGTNPTGTSGPPGKP
jgi:hypothetical protein